MEKAASFPVAVAERHSETPMRQLGRWRKYRAAMLEKRKQYAAAHDEAVCEHCAMEDKLYFKQQVHGHHMVPRSEDESKTFDPANLQFLCSQHHTMRNNLELITKWPWRFVVTGKPGAGKTTFVEQHARPSDYVWDADKEATKLGMPSFPRTAEQQQTLRVLRTDAVHHLRTTSQPAWLICRWPTTAYRLSQVIKADVVELIDKRPRNKWWSRHLIPI